MANGNNVNGDSSPSTSRELLSVTGDGSRRALVESLFRADNRNKGPLRTFQVGRSPLFDQLDTFLPNLQSANEHLQQQSAEEIAQLDIENTTNCQNVVQMNVLVGELADQAAEDDDDDDTIISSSSSSSGSSDSSSEDEAIFAPVTEANIFIPGGHSSAQRRRDRRSNQNIINDNLSQLIVEVDTSMMDDDQESDSESVITTDSAER